MTAEALPERTVIRATWLVAWLGLFAAGFAVVWIGIALVDPALEGFVARVAAAAFGLAVAAPFAWSTRMRIEVDGVGMTVVNLLHTTPVAWSDVFDVVVDPIGILVMRSDGSRIIAASLGKSHISTWLGRRSAADDRLDTVRVYLAAYRSQLVPATPPLPSAPDQS